MNPLIFTDKTTGIYGGIRAKDRAEFIANIEAFHKHFVMERGWIDKDTLAAKTKPHVIVRWIANIVNTIGFKFFNRIPELDLEKIKCGLSSYLSVNVEWIAKNRTELNQDLTIKLFEIDKTIRQKAANSFLERTFSQPFLSPGTWPWIMTLSRVGRIAGVDETGTGTLEIFTKLGWDFNKLKV